MGGMALPHELTALCVLAAATFRHHAITFLAAPHASAIAAGLGQHHNGTSISRCERATVKPPMAKLSDEVARIARHRFLVIAMDFEVLRLRRHSFACGFKTA